MQTRHNAARFLIATCVALGAVVATAANASIGSDAKRASAPVNWQAITDAANQSPYSFQFN